jgi:hypothetical protein
MNLLKLDNPCNATSGRRDSSARPSVSWGLSGWSVALGGTPAHDHDKAYAENDQGAADHGEWQNRGGTRPSEAPAGAAVAVAGLAVVDGERGTRTAEQGGDGHGEHGQRSADQSVGSHAITPHPSAFEPGHGNVSAHLGANNPLTVGIRTVRKSPLRSCR